MWKRIITFIKSIINIHQCDSDAYRYTIKPHYINTAQIGKGKHILRYNVYKSYHCSICNKQHYIYKDATNITAGRVYSKYEIQIK